MGHPSRFKFRFQATENTLKVLVDLPLDQQGKRGRWHGLQHGVVQKPDVTNQNGNRMGLVKFGRYLIRFSGGLLNLKGRKRDLPGHKNNTAGWLIEMWCYSFSNDDNIVSGC